VAGSAWRRSFHAGPSNRDQTFDTAEEKEEMEVNSKRLIRLLTKLLPPQDLSARQFETSEKSVERRSQYNARKEAKELQKETKKEERKKD
jgi:hypothetical protein